MKKSSWLRAGLAAQAFVAESCGSLCDNAAIRLLGLGRDAALSPTEHFFNGLLAADVRAQIRGLAAREVIRY